MRPQQSCSPNSNRVHFIPSKLKPITFHLSQSTQQRSRRLELKLDHLLKTPMLPQENLRQFWHTHIHLPDLNWESLFDVPRRLHFILTNCFDKKFDTFPSLDFSSKRNLLSNSLPLLHL